MKILFVIPSLTCGGAERVVATLAIKFQESGHIVTVMTLSSAETDFYQLPASIKRIGLGQLKKSKGVLGAVTNNYVRIQSIGRVVQETSADVVVSHLTEVNVLTVLAGIRSGVPVVITEHCDPDNISYGRSWTALRRLTYPLAGTLVNVSKGVDRYFSWLSREKRRVIYNPFFAPDQQSQPGLGSHPATNSWMSEIQGPIVVSMGRFTRQKGFDILLRAFSSLVAAGHSDWTLIILGDGELRDQLEQLVDELNLSSRVIMPGRVKDPFSVLRRADLFVMSSRFEGFPMAHGEAMLCGLPVIATDCPSGPSELIRDGVDGILVENENQLHLEEAMQKLMSNAKLRTAMGESAVQVTSRFDINVIVNEWLVNLERLASRR